jgi:hypothetical protein
MTPVDKASEKEKEAVEKEEDLRHEWVREDIRNENRQPHLEELDEDPSAMGE